MLTDVERAPIDALLARLLVSELDEDAVRLLRRPAVIEVLEQLEPGARPWLEAPWTTEREAEAREEFARLFLLPGGVSPCASTWVPGEREQLGVRTTTIVRQCLDALDVEPERGRAWGNLPLDHLGLLLDLAAHAAESTRPADAAIGRRLRAELLGEWPGRFGDALAARAEVPAYRAAGRLLAQLHYPAGGTAG